MFLSAHVNEAATHFLVKVNEYLASFLEHSDGFTEPYFVNPRTFLLAPHAGLWVLVQHKTPRMVNFAFRPMETLSRQVLPEPLRLEYVQEPLLGFRVPAYVLCSVKKAALLRPDVSELAFEAIKSLVELSLREIGRSPELYSAGFADSADVLRRSQASGDGAIQFACALNPNSPPDVTAHLARSHDPLILRAVASRPELSAEEQLALISNPHMDYRSYSALASRFDLATDARERLRQCPIPTVQSYLTGPRVVEYLEQDGTADRLADLSAFFEHLLGSRYLEGVTKRNARYFDYFAGHEQLELEQLVSALYSQGIVNEGVRKIIRQLLPDVIDKDCLARVAARLADSVENIRRCRELRIKPFSYLIQYEHIWKLKGRREDINFNLALEYAAQLYYPRQISVKAIDEAFARTFVHLRNNICWCAGHIGTQEGKTALFILELQSDFFKLHKTHLTAYFKDWPQILLNIVVVEAKRRGIEVIYMVTSEALRTMYGKIYEIKYDTQNLDAWRGIYDANAARLGMGLKRTQRAVNMFPAAWASFECDEFYFAEVENLASLEMVDSSRRLPAP